MQRVDSLSIFKYHHCKYSICYWITTKWMLQLKASDYPVDKKGEWHG